MNITNLETLFDKIDGEILPIAQLVLDAGTQQRAKTDKAAIDGYTESMKVNGVESWEPIQVIQLTHAHTLHDGSELTAGAHILVNGFQRLDACIGANYDTFPTKVCEGTFEEAVYYSMIANKRNGVSLKGADYQKAIKKLYILDAAWREHGKKKELALLFGCSTKTVERAVKAIDAEVKGQCFNMFAEGKTNQQVVDFSHKALNTIKTWREEYEQSLEDEETAKQEKEQAEAKAEADKSDLSYLEMTIGEAMKVVDKEIQAAILAILNNTYGAQAAQDEPKASDTPQDDEPSNDEPDPSLSPMDALAAQWRTLDEYGVHGTTKEKVEKYVNKKAQLNRLHKLALKQCHPDKHGKDNAALAILMDAFSTLKKTWDFK